MNTERIGKIIADAGFPQNRQVQVSVAIFKAFHEYRRASENKELAPHVRARGELEKLDHDATRLLKALDNLSLDASSSLGSGGGQWNVDRWKETLQEIPILAKRAHEKFSDANRREPKLKEFDGLLSGLTLAWVKGWARGAQVPESVRALNKVGIMMRGNPAEGGLIRYEGPLLKFLKNILSVEDCQYNSRGFARRVFDLHPLLRFRHHR